MLLTFYQKGCDMELILKKLEEQLQKKREIKLKKEQLQKEISKIISEVKKDCELNKDFAIQEKLSRKENFDYIIENSRDSYTPSNTRIKYNNLGKAYNWLDQHGQEGEDYE